MFSMNSLLFHLRNPDFPGWPGCCPGDGVARGGDEDGLINNNHSLKFRKR